MAGQSPEAPDPDLARRQASVRAMVFAGLALVVTYLVTRWIAGMIWPDQGDLSDVGTGFWRIGVSALVAVVASVVVLTGLSPRRSR